MSKDHHCYYCKECRDKYHLEYSKKGGEATKKKTDYHILGKIGAKKGGANSLTFYYYECLYLILTLFHHLILFLLYRNLHYVRVLSL